MTEPQYLYLTTTGHITGNPHEIEIWFAGLDGRWYLVSEMRERAHWVQNIQRSPTVTFRVDDRHYQGTARIIDPAAEPDLAQQVRARMDAKYGWSDGMIVELAANA